MTIKFSQIAKAGFRVPTGETYRQRERVLQLDMITSNNEKRSEVH
jgi:hypothetical protein